MATCGATGRETWLEPCAPGVLRCPECGERVDENTLETVDEVCPQCERSDDCECEIGLISDGRRTRLVEGDAR